MLIQTAKFNIEKIDAGDEAISRFGKAMPDHALEAIKKSDACLKGPVGESAADVVLVLRQTMDLYANVRPVKSYPNLKAISDTIDLSNCEGKHRGPVSGLGIRG